MTEPYSAYSAMQGAAFAYAAELEARGFEDVTVYRYDTPLDNREPFHENHRTGFGYAVRYTSDAATDREVARGLKYPAAIYDRAVAEARAPRFHDRSLTVFTGDDALPKPALTRNGGVLADIAGEDVTPYWTAAWSPDEGEHAPEVHSVILKRFPRREDDQAYPWQLGPHRMYHLMLHPVDRALPAPEGDSLPPFDLGEVKARILAKMEDGHDLPPRG